MADEPAPEVTAARALIQQGITDYINACYPEHEGLYVEGWAITAEWASVELEQNNRGGILTATPHGQSLSMSRGLSEFGTEKHSLFDGDDE